MRELTPLPLEFIRSLSDQTTAENCLPITSSTSPGTRKWSRIYRRARRVLSATPGVRLPPPCPRYRGSVSRRSSGQIWGQTTTPGSWGTSGVQGTGAGMAILNVGHVRSRSMCWRELETAVKKDGAMRRNHSGFTRSVRWPSAVNASGFRAALSNQL